MRRSKTVSVEIKVLVAIAAFLLASAAWAQSKPQSVLVTNPSLTVQAADAGRYTHVGQRPSRVVELDMLSHRLGFGFLVDPATGATDTSTEFTVPDGFQFVITDIAGVSQCGFPGSTFPYSLWQVPGPGQFPNQRARLTAVCSSEGAASFERHYTTGLIVGAGNQIHVLGLGSSVFVRVQGYLVPMS